MARLMQGYTLPGLIILPFNRSPLQIFFFLRPLREAETNSAGGGGVVREV